MGEERETTRMSRNGLNGRDHVTLGSIGLALLLGGGAGGRFLAPAVPPDFVETVKRVDTRTEELRQGFTELRIKLEEAEKKRHEERIHELEDRMTRAESRLAREEKK